MKYRVLLTNLKTGYETEIIVPSNLILENLSAKIKLALGFPLCDNAWHRFIVQGITRVVDEHIMAEQEILYECNAFVGRYGSSEHIRLKHAFTVLGSSVTYCQDGNGHETSKARCTLVERI